MKNKFIVPESIVVFPYREEKNGHATLLVAQESENKDTVGYGIYIVDADGEKDMVTGKPVKANAITFAIKLAQAFYMTPDLTAIKDDPDQLQVKSVGRDFPNHPNKGDRHRNEDRVYEWNGTVWNDIGHWLTTDAPVQKEQNQPIKEVWIMPSYDAGGYLDSQYDGMNEKTSMLQVSIVLVDGAIQNVKNFDVSGILDLHTTLNVRSFAECLAHQLNVSVKDHTTGFISDEEKELPKTTGFSLIEIGQRIVDLGVEGMADWMHGLLLHHSLNVGVFVNRLRNIIDERAHKARGDEGEFVPTPFSMLYGGMIRVIGLQVRPYIEREDHVESQPGGPTDETTGYGVYALLSNGIYQHLSDSCCLKHAREEADFLADLLKVKVEKNEWDKPPTWDQLEEAIGKIFAEAQQKEWSSEQIEEGLTAATADIPGVTVHVFSRQKPEESVKDTPAKKLLIASLARNSAPTEEEMVKIVDSDFDLLMMKHLLGFAFNIHQAECLGKSEAEIREILFDEDRPKEEKKPYSTAVSWIIDAVLKGKPFGRQDEAISMVIPRLIDMAVTRIHLARETSLASQYSGYRDLQIETFKTLYSVMDEVAKVLDEHPRVPDELVSGYIGKIGKAVVKESAKLITELYSDDKNFISGMIRHSESLKYDMRYNKAALFTVAAELINFDIGQILPSVRDVRWSRATFVERPRPRPGSMYTIVFGDTLSEISQAAYGRADLYGMIQRSNSDLIKSAGNIQSGWKIYIPRWENDTAKKV